MNPYYETELGKLYHGDCLEIMPELEPVDMILCDLPYGTTACKWDTVIYFEPLWAQYNRLIKNNGAIVLTAGQPFTSALVMSNIAQFKYEWIWEKDKPTNFALANKQPMKYHENICVFYTNLPVYNKQMIRRTGGGEQRCKTSVDHSNRKIHGQDIKYTNGLSFYNEIYKNPSSVLYFNTGRRQDTIHPTQKPVAMFEYLIKTYTNKENTVMDNCIGSGTTAIACERLKRRWIGIEIEEKYCEIAAKRIELERKQRKLF